MRKLKVKHPVRVWRIECHLDKQAQVDFGLLAPIVDAQGKRTRTFGPRIVLSYSRKGYSEAVLRQDTETFPRVLENALRSALSAGCAAHGNAVGNHRPRFKRVQPNGPHNPNESSRNPNK